MLFICMSLSLKFFALKLLCCEGQENVNFNYFIYVWNVKSLKSNSFTLYTCLQTAESCRRSARIHKRQSREFHMPTRQDVFDKIEDDLTSPNKSLAYLKPRKLVNNFTRV